MQNSSYSVKFASSASLLPKEYDFVLILYYIYFIIIDYLLIYIYISFGFLKVKLWYEIFPIIKSTQLVSVKPVITEKIFVSSGNANLD